MIVRLVSWTSNPKKIIYWAFKNMTGKIDEHIDNIKIEDEKEFFRILLRQPHQTVFEFVNTIWYISGVSRAFQQQLTRTRLASYCIQSLRVAEMKNFYDEKQFLIPKDLSERQKKIYEEAMFKIQEYYNLLLESGCKTEDARGILPLNVFSTITMSINLRALYHMLELRLCENTQAEFREVAFLMKKEIQEKLGEEFSECIGPPCLKRGKCNSAVSCGKYNFEKEIEEDITKWTR